ncbi:hypothetical protein ACLOJK_041120 [Asimina triloba]
MASPQNDGSNVGKIRVLANGCMFSPYGGIVLLRPFPILSLCGFKHGFLFSPEGQEEASFDESFLPHAVALAGVNDVGLKLGVLTFDVSQLIMPNGEEDPGEHPKKFSQLKEDQRCACRSSEILKKLSLTDPSVTLQDAVSAIVKQEMHLDDNDDDDESLLNREELQQSNHTRMINNPKAESKERQGVADDKAKDVIRKTIILKRRPPRIDNKSSIPRNFVKHPSNPQSHPATAPHHQLNLVFLQFLPVEASKLEESSLRRYCRYYKLVGRGLKIVRKEDLVCVVRRHFLSQRLDEMQVLDEFVQAFKKLKNAT